MKRATASLPMRALARRQLSVSATMSKTDAVIAQEHRYSAHNYHPLPVALKKGKGVFLWDVDDKVCTFELAQWRVNSLF